MSDNPIENRLRTAYGVPGSDSRDATESDVVVSLRTDPVILPREKVITVTVYVLGVNDCHEPDVFVTQVTCTEQEYYEEFLHLAVAEERAKEKGFGDSMFSFDERENGIVDKLRDLLGKRP